MYSELKENNNDDAKCISEYSSRVPQIFCVCQGKLTDKDRTQRLNTCLFLVASMSFKLVPLSSRITPKLAMRIQLRSARDLLQGFTQKTAGRDGPLPE